MKTILIDAWNTLFTEDGLSTEIFNLLENYPNPKIVVTNANDEQMKLFKIDKSPYEVFTLKHNPDKPNPLYFQTLIQKFKLDVQNILYIEHNIDAVKSAQSIGIKTLLYNKNKKEITQIKKFLQDNI